MTFEHALWFTSDNAAPAAPAVRDALLRVDQDGAASYGADPWMDQVRTHIRELFDAPDAAVYLVATGTAANALAVSCLCPPWGALYCHRHAHVEEDECGAPEFYTGGAKLRLLDGADAKITPATLSEAIETTAMAGVHNVQKGALSLTNATEYGTCYTPGEVGDLADIARSAGIPVHMDGARFANALVQQGCSPADITWRAGVDILSFGGTKNGLMGVEAVVIFDPERAWEFELRRKRGGHLFSKHRYLSAQMLAYLENGLWLDLAAHANERAERLRDGLLAAGAEILYPVQANMVFSRLPRDTHTRLQAGGAKYYFWPGDPSPDGAPDEMLSARMVCAWNTTEADVDALTDLAANATRAA